MPVVVKSVLAELVSAADSRMITLIKRPGPVVERITRMAAIALARRAEGEYHLVIRHGVVKKMVQIEKPAAPFQECYRTMEAAAYPPWPGFHERQYSAGITSTVSAAERMQMQLSAAKPGFLAPATARKAAGA